MSTRIEKQIMVNVPVSTVYNQWTQFEEFPHFMGGVKQVTQLGDDRLEWVAEIGGVRRRWEARILEQVPDRKVAWAATEGATNAGAVTFEDVGGGQTSVRLTLEYEPEGLVEKIGDKLNIVEKQAEGTWPGSRSSSNPRATPPGPGAERSTKVPLARPARRRPPHPAGTAERPASPGRRSPLGSVSPRQRPRASRLPRQARSPTTKPSPRMTVTPVTPVVEPEPVVLEEVDPDAGIAGAGSHEQGTVPPTTDPDGTTRF